MSTLHLRAILSLALALIALLWSRTLPSLRELKDTQAQFSSDLGLSEKAIFLRMTLLLIRNAMQTLSYVFSVCFALFSIVVIVVMTESIDMVVIAYDYLLTFYLVCIAASLVMLLGIALEISYKTVGEIANRVIVRVGLFSPEKLGLSIYQYRIIMISVLIFVSLFLLTIILRIPSITFERSLTIA